MEVEEQEEEDEEEKNEEEEEEENKNAILYESLWGYPSGHFPC